MTPFGTLDPRDMAIVRLGRAGVNGELGDYRSSRHLTSNSRTGSSKARGAKAAVRRPRANATVDGLWKGCYNPAVLSSFQLEGGSDDPRDNLACNG